LPDVSLGRGYIPEDECKEQEAFPANWISPKEQLERLPSIAKEVSIIHELIPDLANIIAEYTGDSCAYYSNWYTALNRLGVRLEKIPPLPNHIRHILEGKCPIYSDQKKPDGTDYKIKDTHVLYLIPKELGTLNHFESEILKPYGEAKYGNPNPLRFRYFWNTHRAEYGDVSFKETHWVLMSKDVLPGSRNKSWEVQAALVDALVKKAFVNYEAPSLQDAFAVMMLHKVATEESLYQEGNEQNGNRWTYTRVQETANGHHLIVGGFAPSGVVVYDEYRRYVGDLEGRGVGALRKF